jgi:ubiquitin C
VIDDSRKEGIPFSFTIGCGPTLEIFVRTRTGRQFPVSVNRNGRIGDLKTPIEEKEGIPWNEQDLVFVEEVLDDKNTFFYYKIKNQDMISVIEVGSGDREFL